MVEEKLIKMGERDDSLPPEYRPTEEERKVAAASIPHPCVSGQRSSLGFICLTSNFDFEGDGKRKEEGSCAKEGKTPETKPVADAARPGR